MIFRSRFPDVVIPEVGLAEFVIGKSATFGDRPALIDGPTGRTVTADRIPPRKSFDASERG